ncbi:uncharacterized protein (TIGR02118 family) [Catenulispora sp. GAS73]|uniref:EthD family reductase n=1 Tax=Catenulispora sp. GAS73 TaxID=3156269 RepID=UPI0035144FFF
MTTTPARFLVFWERPSDPEAFERHYREVHIPLARKIPGLRSYAITDNPVPVRGEPFFRIAELRWDTMDDLRAGLDSPEARAVAADVDKLAVYATCRNMVIEPFEELL